jgi:predicted RNase H-like nuclease (RuvC/YqgF family)
MMSAVIGIDPGAHGAIAVLTEAGQLLGVLAGLQREGRANG